MLFLVQFHPQGETLKLVPHGIEASAHTARFDEPGAPSATDNLGQDLGNAELRHSQDEPAISSQRDWILSDHLALI